MVEKKTTDIDSAWGLSDYNQPGEEETGPNRGRMFLAIVVATFLLGVFNSSALVGWVKGLPTGPVENRIIDTAEVWHGWMEDRGLSGYIDVARTYIASLKDKSWQDLKR